MNEIQKVMLIPRPVHETEREVVVVATGNENRESLGTEMFQLDQEERGSIQTEQLEFPS